MAMRSQEAHESVSSYLFRPPHSEYSIAEAQGRVRTTEDEFGMSLTRVRETEEELLRLRTERTSKFMEAYKVIEKAVQKTYKVSGMLLSGGGGGRNSVG